MHTASQSGDRRRPLPLNSLSRFTLFWLLSVLTTYVVAVYAVVFWSVIGGQGLLSEMAGWLSLAHEVVVIGTVMWALPMAVVLWMPGFDLFLLFRTLLRGLGGQAATMVTAAILALAFAATGLVFFGSVMHPVGYIGLLVGPLIAWVVYRREWAG